MLDILEEKGDAILNFDIIAQKLAKKRKQVLSQNSRPGVTIRNSITARAIAIPDTSKTISLPEVAYQIKREQFMLYTGNGVADDIRKAGFPKPSEEVRKLLEPANHERASGSPLTEDEAAGVEKIVQDLNEIFEIPYDRSWFSRVMLYAQTISNEGGHILSAFIGAIFTVLLERARGMLSFGVGFVLGGFFERRVWASLIMGTFGIATGQIFVKILHEIVGKFAERGLVNYKYRRAITLILDLAVSLVWFYGGAPLFESGIGLAKLVGKYLIGSINVIVHALTGNVEYFNKLEPFAIKLKDAISLANSDTSYLYNLLNPILNSIEKLAKMSQEQLIEWGKTAASYMQPAFLHVDAQSEVGAGTGGAIAAMVYPKLDRKSVV